MNLVELTKLAKVDKTAAEGGVLEFVQQAFPDLGIQTAQINRSAVSLNSVNGFLTSASAEYFFKFHAEENETVTVNEYYNSEILSEVSLPVIKPLYQSTKPGSQFLIYEKISAPTAFELLPQRPADFFKAEEQLLQQVQQTYLSTLEMTESELLANAPLYQLFYHRLVGEQPRVQLFYLSNPWFQSIMDKPWVINGKSYNYSLRQLIETSTKLLNPRHYLNQPSVIGHGDDHNGNKFFIDGTFKFFDPAFAGRQPALLSFVKATAHNSFVHPDWLYTPEQLVPNGLTIEWDSAADKMMVQHNWDVQTRDPNRLRELQLQETIIWKPLIGELRQRGWLPDDWKDYLRCALFCCPFLVYNLLDPKRYTQDTSVLALSKCIELASYDCNY